MTAMTLMTVDFKLLKKKVFVFLGILVFFKLAQYFEVYKLLSLSLESGPLKLCLPPAAFIKG
jgi:hypothetical protein